MTVAVYRGRLACRPRCCLRDFEHRRREVRRESLRVREQFRRTARSARAPRLSSGCGTRWTPPPIVATHKLPSRSKIMPCGFALSASRRAIARCGRRRDQPDRTQAVLDPCRAQRRHGEDAIRLTDIPVSTRSARARPSNHQRPAVVDPEIFTSSRRRRTIADWRADR